MRRLPLALLVFASTVALAGGWQEFLSPGPVAPAHQEHAANCDACHLSFAGIPDVKCLDCHEGLAERIDAGTGFHATVRTTACIDCHDDHKGTDAGLTQDDARATFDHETTGFSLKGAHGEPSCADCHDKPVHEMQGVCGTCHEDAHSSALGPSCSSCHAPIAWTEGLKSLTAHLLSMEGKHGEQSCDDCHTHGANLEGDVPCSACHEDAHGGTSTACDQCHEVAGFKPAKFDHGPCTCAFPGKHQTVSCLSCHEDFDFTDTPIACAGCHEKDRPHDDLGACSVCHTATSWSENLFDHNKGTSFPIVGAHEAVACVQCHEEGTFGKADTACESCHQARGDEAHGSFSDFGGCASCHTVQGFRPSTFDHSKTGFTLSGQHDTLGCPACHDGKTTGYPGRTPSSPSRTRSTPEP